MGPSHIRGIDHVVVWGVDIARSLHFCVEVLGCREERRIDPIGLIQLRAGSSLIDLVDLAGLLGKAGGPAPGRDGRNVDHVAVRLERFDEAELTAQLLEPGVELGDVAERYSAYGTGPSMYIRDPDGNTVELKGPPRSEPA